MVSFRLLNSEIGNDQRKEVTQMKKLRLSFRLLNSEIGNDHVHDLQSIKKELKFSSP